MTLALLVAVAAFLAATVLQFICWRLLAPTSCLSPLDQLVPRYVYTHVPWILRGARYVLVVAGLVVINVTWHIHFWNWLIMFGLWVYYFGTARRFDDGLDRHRAVGRQKLVDCGTLVDLVKHYVQKHPGTRIVVEPVMTFGQYEIVLHYGMDGDDDNRQTLRLQSRVNPERVTYYLQSQLRPSLMSPRPDRVTVWTDARRLPDRDSVVFGQIQMDR